MEVLFFLLPIAVAFASASLLAFRWALRQGQFDDLETPAIRILFDDEDTRTP